MTASIPLIDIEVNMAVITVKELGQVRIKGDKPTLEEQQIIIKTIKQKKKKKELEDFQISQTDLSFPIAEKLTYEDMEKVKARTQAIDAYLKSPEFKRLGLEIGLAVGGAMTGGTLTAARYALRPAIQMLYRSLGAGVGQATGAGIASTTFDPKEELSKDVAILKKDSHPPVFTKEQYDKLDERVKTMEAFFDNIERISSEYIKDVGN